MIYFVAGLFAVCAILQIITFWEVQTVKEELGSRWLRGIADAPKQIVESPEIADESAEEPIESIDTSELTETELLIIEREAEFDLRISKMKEELASRIPEKKSNPTEAVSLHPLVQNLPHNIIMDSYDSLPDVEYHV